MLVDGTQTYFGKPIISCKTKPILYNSDKEILLQMLHKLTYDVVIPGNIGFKNARESIKPFVAKNLRIDGKKILADIIFLDNPEGKYLLKNINEYRFRPYFHDLGGIFMNAVLHVEDYEEYQDNILISWIERNTI